MRKNLVIIFTGTVATTLADKIILSFSKDEYNVSSIFTEKSKYFVDMHETVKKHFYVFSDETEWRKERYEKNDDIPHVDFATNNDALLIIASADFIAKMVNGQCDDLASSLYRAWHRYKPVIVAPGMNTHMWEHPITRTHITKLQEWNITVVKPQVKKLACGELGMGALADVEDIKQIVEDELIGEFPIDVCNGIPTGDKHPGAFLYPRKHAPHTGVDLYSKDGEVVRSICVGKVLSIEDFTGNADNSPWWEDTKCIVIEHWFGVVCYGEINKTYHKIGDYVHSNEVIGHVKQVLKTGKERRDIPGHSLSMLHVELYPHGAKKASRSYELDKDILIDPTPILTRINKVKHNFPILT